VAIFLFGCTNNNGNTTPTIDVSNQTPIQENESNDQEPELSEDSDCVPSYSFSTPGDGILSYATTLVGTVTCGKGSVLSAKVDGVEVDEISIDSDAATPVRFRIIAPKNGKTKLTVDNNGALVFSRDWKVDPIGNDNIGGLGYDAVSFKEWKAMAVDVESKITIDQVKLYMKRIEAKTEPSTLIYIEIRKDQDNKPGDLITTAYLPISETTLSKNWIKFDVDQTTLSKGRYWIVVRVEQMEDAGLVSDVVNLYYEEIDREAKGNDHTLEMRLDVDKKTGVASETEWSELSYDRVYNIILPSGD